MYDLDELYQEVIMDHNRRPRNFKRPDGANKTAEGFNPLCGDRITVYLEVDGDTIADVGFISSGCAISKASASMMTEGIKGKTIGDAERTFKAFRGMVTQNEDGDVDPELLGDLEILSGVSKYPARIKCATLSWHTLQAALLSQEEKVSTER